MKVGTDSIMLGSWVQAEQAKRILDIGVGSGLLSIMLAQKTQPDCLIDGIDIDAAAISQATENAKNCPWFKRISFKQTSLQQFSATSSYDLIISNPPYFQVNHAANKVQLSTTRASARQTLELDHPTLLQNVAKHLTAKGQFYCVLPAVRVKAFIAMAEPMGLYCSTELQVQPKPNSPVSRSLLKFSFAKAHMKWEKLSIYNHLGSYSKEYVALCGDYYLNF